MLSPGKRSHPSDIPFNTNHILPGKDLEQAKFSPILAPTISHNPILLLSLFIETPSDHRHSVSLFSALIHIVENASFVVSNRFSIDRDSNRSSSVNFTFNGMDIVLSATIFSHSDIWVLINSRALAAEFFKSVTGSADILGFALEMFLIAFTVAIGGFSGTSFIDKASIERDPS